MMPGIGFIGKHLHLSTATIYIYVLKYGPIQSNVKVCFGFNLNQMKLTGGQLSIVGGYSWPEGVDIVENWDEDRWT